MNIKSEDLRDCLTKGLFSYISENLIGQTSDSTNSLMLLQELEIELVNHCNNKIFTVFNTNVVSANQTRVLSNSSLRTFYFHLFSHLNFYLRFDFGVENVYKEVFEKLFITFSNGPLIYSASDQQYNYTGFNPAKEIPGYLDLASKLDVKFDVLKFLERNQWYFVHVLLTLFSHQLTEDLQIFLSNKK